MAGSIYFVATSGRLAGADSVSITLVVDTKKALGQDFYIALFLNLSM